MRATAPPSPIPLLVLEEVSKIYRSGATELRALDRVSLVIGRGEFVAIMGQSGSGKSTLLNILGCLDRASAGRYLVAGRDTATLDGDELARLRCRHFGFVFQRYNLLGTATAQENVEIPAVYAGRPGAARAVRAFELLQRLGMADRAQHRPAELSGGQQQRVSIARALMNEALVILADEPTGALDTASGEEVLRLLEELHAEGRTVILITHDPEIAARAERVIELRDGRVVRDTGPMPRVAPTTAPAEGPQQAGPRMRLTELGEAMRTAVRSLRGNLFRTALTLLGIVIGVAAVIAMQAIGDGSQRVVMDRIGKLGTDLLIIRPGAPGVRPTGEVATLTVEDAEALAKLPNVHVASPERYATMTTRVGSIDYRTGIYATTPDYADSRDWELARGRFFEGTELDAYAPVAVLGQTVVRNLFPDGEDPIGRYMLIRNVPLEVVGVLAPKGGTPGGGDLDDIVVVPLTTGAMRLFGKRHLSLLTIEVLDTRLVGRTEELVRATLLERHHGREDFQIRNMTAVLETATATQRTLTTLLAVVALISLLVGGIGVMNIMLVNVTERTREIGIRMATGARRAAILLQFNTEALVVCACGGLAGLALGFAVAWGAAAAGMAVVYRPAPAFIALACAFATGLVFGFLPARKAARLDPVTALAAE